MRLRRPGERHIPPTFAGIGTGVHSIVLARRVGSGSKREAKTGRNGCPFDRACSAPSAPGSVPVVPALPTAMVLLACGAHLEGGPGPAVELGERLEFELFDVEGRPHRARDHRGRVVLVEVWATWCGPCEASLAQLSDLTARMSGERFDVVSIAVDRDRAALASFLRERTLPFPVLWDPSASVLARLGARDVPTTLLLDAFGRLIFVHPGGAPDDARRIERALRYALSASSVASKR